MKKRRGPWTFEAIAVPPETYPDLQINPSNSCTELTDEERIQSVIQGLANIIIDSRREKPKTVKGE